MRFNKQKTSVKPDKNNLDCHLPNTRLPAEWEKQDAVMLTWPHSQTDWRHSLEAVEPTFVEIAQQLIRFQKLFIVCNNITHKTHIQSLLNAKTIDQTQLFFFCIPSNDTWIRDYGPMTIYKNGQAELIDFRFNGWGNKYDSQLDNNISRELYRLNAFKGNLSSENFVLEGGSIESNGQGTLLTTAQCLLSARRNPNLSQSEISNFLSQKLGAEEILWLNHGNLIGDDTDGHIDTIARFIDAETICYVKCDTENDEHYIDFQKMEAELKQFRTKQGKPYRLIPLPMVSAKYSKDKTRLPATYANFLIINQAVLVPTYRDINDDNALSIIKNCLPNREVIGINCEQIIEQNGSLHCLTMHLPHGIVAAC